MTTRQQYAEAYRVKRMIGRNLTRAERIEEVANQIVINRRRSKSIKSRKRIKKYELIARMNSLLRDAEALERQFNRYPKPIRRAAQESYTASRRSAD